MFEEKRWITRNKTQQISVSIQRIAKLRCPSNVYHIKIVKNFTSLIAFGVEKFENTWLHERLIYTLGALKIACAPKSVMRIIRACLWLKKSFITYVYMSKFTVTPGFVWFRLVSFHLGNKALIWKYIALIMVIIQISVRLVSYALWPFSRTFFISYSYRFVPRLRRFALIFQCFRQFVRIFPPTYLDGESFVITYLCIIESFVLKIVSSLITKYYIYQVKLSRTT